MTTSQQIHVGVGALLGLAAAWLAISIVGATTGHALITALAGVSLGSVMGWMASTDSGRASAGRRRRR